MIPGKERGGSNSTVALFWCGGVGECCKGMGVLLKNTSHEAFSFTVRCAHVQEEALFSTGITRRSMRKSHSCENSDLPRWLFPLLG